MYQNYRWRRYRDEFIKLNPFCYACGGKAEVCDHIKAHKGDWDLFEDTENHLPLCHNDHNYCTSNFDKYDVPKTKEKIEWITAKRRSSGLTRKVYILSRNIYFPKT